MTVAASVGTVFSLSSSVPATYDAAGYAALVDFVAVSEITSIGDYGGTGQVIPYIDLATGTENKVIGSFAYGSMDVPFSKEISDAGQLLITEGFDGANKRAEHSVKIEDSAGNIAYISVKIASDITSISDANSITSGSTSFEVLRKPVIVVAP